MPSSIPLRPLDFDFDPARVPERWYGDDLVLSLFFDALSLLFPDGERFFVESVKPFRARLTDPELVADVAGFIGQEAMHGRAHRAFNAMLERQGMEVAPRLAEVRALLDRVHAVLPARAQLAVTCALEHFTAILAEQLLAKAEHRDAIDASMQRLWLWHALEESEHKSVAFDVFVAVGGRDRERVIVMALTTIVFFAVHTWVHARLLADRRALVRPVAWWRALRYLWVRPGLLRQLGPAYFAYYRRGFHPRDRDTTALLDEWRARLFDDARGAA